VSTPAASASAWARPALRVLLYRSVYLLANFGSLMLLPRVLGTVGYGEYGWFVGLEGLLMIVANFGLDSVLGRFVPEHAMKGHHSELARLFSSAASARLVLGVVCGVALAATLYLTDLTCSPWLLAATVALTTAEAQSGIAFSYLAARGRDGSFILGSLLQVGTRLLFVALMVTMAHLGTIEAIVLGSLESELLVLIVGITRTRHSFRLAGFRTCLEALRPIWVFAFSACINTLMASAFRRIGIIWLRQHSGPSEMLGHFHLANQLQISVILSLNALLVVYLPRLVPLHDARHPHRVERGVMVAMGLFLGLGLLGVLLFSRFGGWLIPSLAGARFEEAAPMVVVGLVPALPLGLITLLRAPAMLARSWLPYNAVFGVMTGIYGLGLLLWDVRSPTEIFVAQGFSAGLGLLICVMILPMGITLRGLLFMAALATQLWGLSACTSGGAHHWLCVAAGSCATIAVMLGLFPVVGWIRARRSPLRHDF